MTDLEMTWQWETASPFHIGSGFSRAGFADRTVRLEGGHAIIPSAAVKGAIRGAAEQLCRWLGAVEEETETESIPRIPALRRIFAPNEKKQYYRFCSCRSEKTVREYTFSSTKIDSKTGAADDNTLRTIEILPSGVIFQGRIQLLAGEWLKVESAEHHDVLLLAAALLATETIGGKKGVGLGRLQCRNLRIGDQPAGGLLTNACQIARLRALVTGGK